MSEKKPQPLVPARIRNRCPVCGEISYSRGGIHPQCSVRKADKQRKNRIKGERLAAKEEKSITPASGLAPWQKSCPKCKSPQHVRKTVCSCGHTFAVGPRPPASEGEQE